MEFRLLGPLEISDEDEHVELRPKERTLLAVLLLHANETVSGDRLIDEIWGSQPPASASKVLATYVWQLRKRLGDRIATRSPGYASVVAPDELDAARFRALVGRAQEEAPLDAAATLREALELWRGPALADVAFESSAATDVARLEDERFTALAQRIDHDLALGRHEEVLPELRELVSAHPFRERYRAQLMLALYRSGRQTEALESYRDARQRLVEELGIEPGPELQRLERAILAQDPALEASESAPQRPAAGMPARSSLPRPASSFVGREHELRDVVSELREGTRLLTLTGPGGAGKTRLALEAAHVVGPTLFEETVWVDLASLRDAELVLDAIAEAAGVRGDLAEALGERQVLLLIDNFEQVIDAASDLASLVQRCPRARLLVTSRERLRVQGEVEYPIPPLTGSDAVSLFCDRSRLAPSPEIGSLCARLDNLPLAVELAAARAKALSPAQILERIDERLLDLLKGGRDADPRQRTLRAAIEWSYDLLSPEERELFARLSVLEGGGTLDGVVEVCEAELDTLESLVEKSLVRVSGERYRMLETVRELAGEKLAASGELDEVMERLARYLVRLANEEGAPFFRGRATEAYARLHLERASIRGVAAWASEHDRRELMAELVARYYNAWTTRTGLGEACGWADIALEARGRVPVEQWPEVLLAVEQVRLFAGDLAGARAVLDEALEAIREADVEPHLEAMLLSELAALTARDRNYAEARRAAVRSLEIREEHGLLKSRALVDLGHIALVTGDLEEARDLLGQAHAGSTASGSDHLRAAAARMLGETARRRGDPEEARARTAEALRMFADIHDIEAVAACVRDLAVLAKESGEVARAARLWRAAEALHPVAESSRDTDLFPQPIGAFPDHDPAALPADLTLNGVLSLLDDSPP